MSLINTRFILLPCDNTVNNLDLRYTDLLIYLSLRSFNNTEQELCFPAYEAIAERAGVERQCVMDAIKRLEKSKLVIVKKSAKRRSSNHYLFADVRRYNRIPYSVFEADDLTFHQKAMLIYIRHLFDSSLLKCSITAYTEIGLLLGLSYKTVYTQLTGLVKLGYITKDLIIYKSGRKSKLGMLSLTNKINWMYIENPVETKSQETFDIKFV